MGAYTQYCMSEGSEAHGMGAECRIRRVTRRMAVADATTARATSKTLAREWMSSRIASGQMAGT